MPRSTLMAGALVTVLAMGIAAWAAHAQTAPTESQGKLLFREQGCYGCHTIDKFGTPIGPDLSHVGSKYSAEYLRGWLTDPASQRPWAHMPKLQLTRPEIEALAAYLASLP